MDPRVGGSYHPRRACTSHGTCPIDHRARTGPALQTHTRPPRARDGARDKWQEDLSFSISAILQEVRSCHFSAYTRPSRGGIVERAHSCIVDPSLDVRTAASTFNHQLDAIQLEDAQAPHRPAEPPSSSSSGILPQETFFATLNILFTNLKPTFIFFCKMGPLYGAAFHNSSDVHGQLRSPGSWRRAAVQPGG